MCCIDNKKNKEKIRIHGGTQIDNYVNKGKLVNGKIYVF